MWRRVQVGGLRLQKRQRLVRAPGPHRPLPALEPPAAPAACLAPAEPRRRAPAWSPPPAAPPLRPCRWHWAAMERFDRLSRLGLPYVPGTHQAPLRRCQAGCCGPWALQLARYGWPRSRADTWLCGCRWSLSRGAFPGLPAPTARASGGGPRASGGGGRRKSLAPAAAPDTRCRCVATGTTCVAQSEFPGEDRRKR